MHCFYENFIVSRSLLTVTVLVGCSYNKNKLSELNLKHFSLQSRTKEQLLSSFKVVKIATKGSGLHEENMFQLKPE